MAVGLFALSRQSVSAIQGLLIIRAVTDGLDFVHNALAGNLLGGGFAAIMLAIEILALVKIKTTRQD